MKLPLKIQLTPAPQLRPLYYKGQLGILKILLGSGKADINATTEGNADTILHILARNTWNFHDKVYIECLKLALSYSDVIVDVTERCDGMTPLAIATESTCKEAVIALLKAGKP